MLKKISAILLAFLILGSVQACSMPDAIFGDESFSDQELDDIVAALDIYSFDFTLDDQDFELPVYFGALYARGWRVYGTGGGPGGRG